MKETMYDKAASQAKKELEKDKVSEIKNLMKELLQAMEDQKSTIAKAQRKLKALKADFKDLELGKLDSIKERHSKDKLARDISPIKERDIIKYSPMTSTTYGWGGTTGSAIGATGRLTDGTYTILCSSINSSGNEVISDKTYYIG